MPNLRFQTIKPQAMGDNNDDVQLQFMVFCHKWLIWTHLNVAPMVVLDTPTLPALAASCKGSFKSDSGTKGSFLEVSQA